MEAKLIGFVTLLAVFLGIGSSAVLAYRSFIWVLDSFTTMYFETKPQHRFLWPTIITVICWAWVLS